MLFEKVINRKYKVLESPQNGAPSVPSAGGEQNGQGSPSGQAGVENYTDRTEDAAAEDSKGTEFESYKLNLKNTLLKFVNYLVKTSSDVHLEPLLEQCTSALSQDADQAFDLFKKIVDATDSKDKSKYESDPIKSLEDFQKE